MWCCSNRREREREREREFARTKGPSVVGISRGICFSPKFSTLYSLITQTQPHTMLALHWSRRTPTQRLRFTGHTLHPRKSCFWNRFVDFTYGRIYRSSKSAGFIAGQGDILSTDLCGSAERHPVSAQIWWIYVPACRPPLMSPFAGAQSVK